MTNEALTINVYRSITFPASLQYSLLGNVTLHENMSNCLSSINITINLSLVKSSTIYIIEFVNSRTIGGIGEVTFRDEVTHTCKLIRYICAPGLVVINIVIIAVFFF